MIKDLYFKFGLYSQIWLNLPRDGCHFFYFFQWKLPLSLQTKIPGKKNTITKKITNVFFLRNFEKKILLRTNYTIPFRNFSL
jgi:hypothetical protein